MPLVTTIAILILISIAIIWQWQPGGVNFNHCILLGVIILSGFYYYQWRLPTAGNLDISHYLSNQNVSSANVTVQGVLISNPQINQSQKGKFILQVQQLITEEENQTKTKVTGKIYVTAPLLQVTGLYPSTAVELKGYLYQPQNTLNPGGFNFADYLNRQGIFTGLSAYSLEVLEQGNWWQLRLSNFRHRIIKAHVRYLKVPQGNLVSSMVMGSRAVDLDFELQESFRLAGLAHTLAASGFHVSILLGLLLYLTRSLNGKNRLLIVSLSLLSYATIAGFYPSILRACLMGLAVVIGTVYDRKVKVYASLLLSGVILLLINPLWIWDLGFQLSFLATWSLIVCLPAIVERLDWMPPTLANLVAVPLAATIWILPLQCYVFHYLPLYGVVTNVLATPFVFAITLGGFISAFFALFIPLLGSAIAYGLFLPVQILIFIVESSNNLPFSALAVGEINLIQLLSVYGIFTIICLSKKVRKYWLILTIATVVSIVVPLIEHKLNLVQVTLLNTRSQPIIVIQNHHNNTIINLIDKESARFNLIPFLRSQGINQSSLLFDTSNAKSQIAINLLSKYIKIISQDNFTRNNDFSINQAKNIQFNLQNTNWLIMNSNDDLTQYNNVDILVYNDRHIDEQKIRTINPKTVIINANIKDKKLVENLSTSNRQIFSSSQNGIQWQPEKGFTIYGKMEDAAT